MTHLVGKNGLCGEMRRRPPEGGIPNGCWADYLWWWNGDAGWPVRGGWGIRKLRLLGPIFALQYSSGLPF